MAAPIIDSITITPSTIVPGGSADVRVVAHDPDSGTVNISVTVTDFGGNVTQGSGVIPVNDVLSYAVSADRGSLTQESGDPGLWHFTDA
jgi:hypothetical protein